MAYGAFLFRLRDQPEVARLAVMGRACVKTQVHGICDGRLPRPNIAITRCGSI
jgi:hypothetical protein